MIKKILLVDDSPVAIKILKRCLPTDYEFECFSANNGAKGIETYKNVKPDLTFLDLTMPVMNGVEALEEIMEYDKDALVIIITADGQKEIYDKVISIGALMLIRKPPSRDIIKAAVLKAMDTHKNRELSC